MCRSAVMRAHHTVQEAEHTGKARSQPYATFPRAVDKLLYLRKMANMIENCLEIESQC